MKTKSTRLHVINITLFATMLAVLFSIACSGADEELTPKPTTPATTEQRNIQAAADTIANSANTIAASADTIAATTQRAMEQLSERMSAIETRPDPTPIVLTITNPEPTPEPSRVVLTTIPTDSILPKGPPGICARTPAVQRALLNSLQATLCQDINEHELFRITELPEITLTSVQKGDFFDLPNVAELNLRLPNLHMPPAVLEGLSSLSKATIYAPGFHPQSLSELSTLRTLDIIMLPDANQASGQLLPHLRLARLSQLRIGYLRELQPRTMPTTLFNGLPQLARLNLIVSPTAVEDDPAPFVTLPPSQFAANTRLTHLEIRQGPGQQTTLQLPPGLFQTTPLLTNISIYTKQLNAPPHVMTGLTKLTTLNINEFSADSKPTLLLSDDSPLYKSIRSGTVTPEGFNLPEIPS